MAETERRKMLVLVALRSLERNRDILATVGDSFSKDDMYCLDHIIAALRFTARVDDRLAPGGDV